MIMLMPTIDRYVTAAPWTVDAEAKLVDAHALMRAHRVRHVPVLDGDALVGILSERDVYLLQSVASVAPEMRVREAMNAPVYAVPSGTALDVVASRMSEHKYGSAVLVGSDGAIAGIFTTVDACRALAELLQRAVG